MSEYILNLLPLNEQERAAFEAMAPDATHVYAGRRTATPEQYAQATVILGWPRPKDLTQCKNYTEFLMLRRIGKGFVGEEYGDAVSLGNGFYITKRNTAVEIQRKYLLLNEVFCLSAAAEYCR